MAILEINHLKKSFGQQTVLKDVHFSVKEAFLASLDKTVQEKQQQ